MLSAIANKFASYFAPPTPAPRLPEEKARQLYPAYRWRALEATFLGYAAFYLVRNNLSTVAKELESDLGYSHSAIGDILAITAISYGVGKLVMGMASDRSDSRKFMAFGLLLTACCNFAFGSASNYYAHLGLWSLNGFVQGMGWPPCGRTMGHWFSESERGLTFSIWNTSHNLGGGIAGALAAWATITFGGWQYAFFVPGVIAVIGACYLFWRLRDTPQSVGLPRIEDYRRDYPQDDSGDESAEKNLSFRELLFRKVLSNRTVWLLAIANFFAYITRYSVLDWGPTYLREVKNASLATGGLAVMVNEFGGIPSTICLGWVSDRVGGRRGMVAALCMAPIVAAVFGLIYTPPGYTAIDMTMLAIIGLFIYPVINLIVIAALDDVSKKAIGTAAGFIGLFGYIGRTVQAKGFGAIVDYMEPTYGYAKAWETVLYLVIASSVMAGLLLAFTWNLRPRA